MATSFNRSALDRLMNLFPQKKILRPVPTKQQQVNTAAQRKSYYQPSPTIGQRVGYEVRKPLAALQQSGSNTPYLGDAAKAYNAAYQGTKDFGKALGTAAGYKLGGEKHLAQNQATAQEFMRQGNYKAAAALYGANQKEYENLASFTPGRIAKGAVSTLALGLGVSQPLSNPLGYAKFATGATGIGAGFGAAAGALSGEDIAKSAYQGS